MKRRQLWQPGQAKDEDSLSGLGSLTTCFQICSNQNCERRNEKWQTVVYVFYKRLYRCDNVWWIVGKYIHHLTVDFDMDAEEDIKMLKADYECRKRLLIDTDLEYTPAYDIGHLNVTKKGRKLLMQIFLTYQDYLQVKFQT